MEKVTVAQTTPAMDGTLRALPKLDSLVGGRKRIIPLATDGPFRASSIACSPQAFVHAEGDYGLLEMFADHKDFEMTDTIRSLRFAAAATTIGNLLEPTSAKFPSPTPVRKTNAWQMEDVAKVNKTVAKNSAEGHLGNTGEMEATAFAVDNGAEKDAASTSEEPEKQLTSHLLDAHERGRHSFIIEPVTPPRAAQDVPEPKSRKGFPSLLRSVWLANKASATESRDVTSVAARRDGAEDDVEGPSSRRSQALSRLMSKAERFLSKLSSSRPGDANPDIWEDPPPVSEVITEDLDNSTHRSAVPRGIKLRLARLKAKVKRILCLA